MGALYMGNKVGREGGREGRREGRREGVLTRKESVVQDVAIPCSILFSLPPSPQVLFKGDSKVAIVMEQCIRLLHACGLPREDLDFISGEGAMMEALLLKAGPRMTQFT